MPHRFKFSVSQWLPIHLALLFLMVPFRLLLAILLSIIIHEAGHLAAIRLCKIPVRNIMFSLTGAKIITSAMSNNQELFCSAAGPFASFLMLLFARYFPLLSICSLFHGVFNLLPIGSMDGARIMRSFFQMVLKRYTIK